MFHDIDDAIKALPGSQIAQQEEQIERFIATDHTMTATARILRSVSGIGPVASTMLLAEMPELVQITGELTGLAPIAHDSGSLRGKRTVDGGRRPLRHVMFQVAMVANYHIPAVKTFADRLRTAGKPHKLIITAIARKLVTIANALCNSQQMWNPKTV